MKTIINKVKSKIRIKRSTLLLNSAHAEVELWGVIPDGSTPNTGHPKLLNFGASTEQPGMIYVKYINSATLTDYITPEEFSQVIWSLPIINDDGNKVTSEESNIIYEQLVRSKKMFTTIKGLPS
jgi:hypothetical protein